ncbi:MAG TPA: helix-turn-helix domain-containing protein [Candidatus Mediterraneibacter intestinipullorum]|nr:helix-turn-helix domain-containing protein [Candidatus Mediterraneibacter avicola]HJA80710.1 helix-turn-helix domain-containing protein [Candidatus Mediterraneibacter intestinipullorum]
MILADKIAELRKKNGWSQEELAGQLGVSRQSVSKWESASSIPDLDKILKMSEVFGVSTDYLLKDSNEPEGEAFAEAALDVTTVSDSDCKIRTVSLEEANTFMDIVQNMAAKVAAGVSICVLSPILLILLAALSDQEGGHIIPEALAVAVGLPVLLVMVAGAVALFIWYGRKTERFEYLEKDLVELAYGVTGVVEKRKKGYEPSHGVSLVIGVGLCILSAIPLFVLGALDENGMLAIYGVIFCLMIVSAGVFFLIRTCMIFGSFQKLLEEGDYSRARKTAEKRNEVISTVYWCVVTAVYLGWSFYTMEWYRTWIIWPCAGVLFGAVLGISSVIHNNKA